MGQVLASSLGCVLLGWHEPHPPRNVATPICILDRHWLGSPWTLLVPLQNGTYAFHAWHIVGQEHMSYLGFRQTRGTQQVNLTG